MSSRARPPVTRLPSPPKEYDEAWAKALIRALEQKATVDGRPLVSGYTISNYTETRTLNAGTATATDVANFVCTLVVDLIAAGAVERA